MLAVPERKSAVAVRAVQAYCERQQIEKFQAGVHAEEGEGRTIRRLENLFALCILAYVFATDHLRKPGLYDSSQPACQQPQNGIGKNARLSGGHPHARGRAEDPLHQRMAEKVSRENLLHWALAF